MDKVITVKTDAATKKAAKSLADEAGLSLSGLVNICLKQVIVSRQLEICLSEQMTPTMEKILEKAECELEAGDFSGPFDNPKSAIAALKKRTG